jgi:hypothetical protein
MNQLPRKYILKWLITWVALKKFVLFSIPLQFAELENFVDTK